VSDSETETEIKVPVAELSSLRRRLEKAGATPKRKRHDEDNTLYDDGTGRLGQAGCALRLRTAEGKGVLTFKGPAQFEGNVKSREELQTDVADAETLRRILERLGFLPKFRYQKRREEFELRSCTVCLDETPIGCFIEIEGDASKIPEALADLGLSASDAVRDSYAGLYGRKRRQDPSLPPDMLFSR